MFRLAALLLFFALSNPGTLLWEVRPVGRDFGGLAESNGVLLAGNVTSTGGIFAFSAETGKLLWQHRGEQMRGGISSDGQRAFAVFDNSGPHHLVAYDLKTGKLLWNVAGDTKFGSDFATIVDNDRVYLMSQDGHVDAFNTATGARLWQFTYSPSDAECPTGMVLANSRLIFGGGQHDISHSAGKFLWAIDPATGKELWKYQSHLTNSDSSDCYATPAVSGDTVVVTTLNFVLAVRASTGALLWTGKAEGISGGYPKPYPLSAPVIANGIVFAARSKALCSWSLANGKPLPDYAVDLGDGERAHLAALDTTLFFLGDLAADAGTPGKRPLHAMDVQTGKILWTHRVNRQTRFIEDWSTNDFLPTPTAVYYENNSLIAKVSR